MSGRKLQWVRERVTATRPVRAEGAQPHPDPGYALILSLEQLITGERTFLLPARTAESEFVATVNVIARTGERGS